MTWDSLIRRAGSKESQWMNPCKDTERHVTPAWGKRATKESRGIISLKQRPGEIRNGDQNKDPMCTLNLKLNPHRPLTSGSWDSLKACLLEDGLSYFMVQMLTTQIYNFINSRKHLNQRLQSTTKHKSLKNKADHYTIFRAFQPTSYTRNTKTKTNQTEFKAWGPWSLLHPTPQQPTTENFSWADLPRAAAQHRCLHKQTLTQWKAQSKWCKPTAWWLSDPTSRLRKSFLATRRH